MSRSAPATASTFGATGRLAAAIIAAVVSAFTALATPAAAAEGDAPKVVASIKPIHSLVAAVMEGVGVPDLIVKGAASPHTYSMKPSDASALQAADVVFWAGDDLEAFLVKPVATLATRAEVVELIDAPGLRTLPFREGGPFEAHDHGDGHGEEHGDGHEAAAEPHAVDETEAGGHEEHHHHGNTDMHFWLDPENAKAMTAAIETTLAAADPAHAGTYRANAEKLEARLDRLADTTRAELEPVRGRPFVVFHDAYQYFETRFGVTAAGSITVSPEQIPGVQRIAAIQAKVKSLGATCVFAEPQFEPKLISVVTENTDARTGILDPEGAALADGPELYFQLIGDLAGSLKSCLSGDR